MSERINIMSEFSKKRTRVSQLMYCVNCDKVWWLKCGYGTKLSVIDAGSVVVSEDCKVMVNKSCNRKQISN